MRPCLLRRLCAVILASCAACRGLRAAPVEVPAFRPLRKLYVSTRGKDAHDGLSPKRPFRTIGKAARAVRPGDLVLVSGGTYFEHVHLKKAGTAEHPIVFRSAPDETVVVTYGVRVDEWAEVPGSRFVYSTPYAHPPIYVWEDRTVREYVAVKGRAILNDLPGSFYYDADRKLAMVHPLGGPDPNSAGIVIIGYSRYPGFGAKPKNALHGYVYGKGFCFVASHNRIEGFTICYQPLGVQFRTSFCEVWNCTVYGCRAGITFYKGNNCVIAGNTCFGNHHSGICVRAGASDTVVRDNLCWDNCPRGPFRSESGGRGHPQQIAVYGAIGDLTFVRNTLIADRSSGVLRYKSLRGTNVTTHNLLVGGSGKLSWGTDARISHNTVIGGNLRIRGYYGGVVTPESAAKRNLERPTEAKANLYLRGRAAQTGFADPVRHDYRLRADSPHIGRGASPAAAPLRYVSPDGDDAADGRSPKTAWKTLAKAAASCAPGDTVYVRAGTYAETLAIAARGTRERPIAFRTHHRGRVVIDGLRRARASREGRNEWGITLTGSEHVTLDGFIVKGFRRGPVRLVGSSNIRLVQSVFDGGQTGVTLTGCGTVCVENNTIRGAGRAIVLARAAGTLIVRNNLFVDIEESPIGVQGGSAGRLLSECNAFGGADAEGMLARWQRVAPEAHASFVTEVRPSSADYLLPKGSPLAFAGVNHKPVGARNAERESAPVSIEGFRAATVLPTQATLVWKTPRDFSEAALTWTSTGEQPRRTAVRQDFNLKSAVFAVKLSRLSPGKRYEAKLEVTEPEDKRTGTAALTFNTPLSTRAPTTLHVSPAGDDRNNGRSAARSFRTLSAAALAAVPGDTVLVARGVYAETLTIWCGGVAQKQRLTWRSEKPGGAIIDCGDILSGAIRMADVKHVTVDGFRIRGLMYGPNRKAVVLDKVDDVVLQNNVFEPRPGIRCGSEHILARTCRNIVIRNNLFQYPWVGVTGERCENVAVDHNTFYLGAIAGVVMKDKENRGWRMTNNIFVDVVDKHATPAIGFWTDSSAYDASQNITCDHNLYWRKRCEKMGLFGFITGDRAQAKTVADLQKRFGFGLHSRFGDPMFADPRRGDFRLSPGSPALGMGVDGKDVGMDVSVMNGAGRRSN